MDPNVAFLKIELIFNLVFLASPLFLQFSMHTLNTFTSLSLYHIYASMHVTDILFYSVEYIEVQLELLSRKWEPWAYFSILVCALNWKN